jgi:hypothetical protein
MSLITPVFLHPESNHRQYRPAVDATGCTVIFERTPAAGGDTKLYTMALGQTSPTPVPFLQASVLDAPTIQTRPDVCWKTGRVAFNGAPSSSATKHVVIAKGDGSAVRHLQGSDGWVYPAWSAHGGALAVMNSSASASPKPCTSQVDPSTGAILEANLDGHVGAVPMFGGMPAVNPTNAIHVAYAGQPDTGNWNGKANYDQDFNYVFVNSGSSGSFSSAPLEPGASTSAFDPHHQGRAPAWSPDARWVVFESNRLGGYALFLFDTHNPSAAAVQLTATSYGAQHAKFLPNGTSLVLSAVPKPGAQMAVATLDISGIVT